MNSVGTYHTCAIKRSDTKSIGNSVSIMGYKGNITIPVTWIWYIIWTGITTAVGIGLYALHHHVHDLSLTPYTPRGLPTIVYDEAGKEITRFRRETRSCAAIHHLPEHVTYAFLAAEDHTFFHHHGISLPGIIRSVIKNVCYGRIVQGASTITQQLIKLTYFHGERSFSRKLKEQLLAIYIERCFTKTQILQAYLNHIYLGRGVYGAQAGSLCYWSKNADDLSVAEAASLAAIVQSPATYNPILHPHYNQERRDVILQRMHTLGYIDDQAYADAIQEPVTLNVSEPQKACSNHVIEHLRTELEAILGTDRLYAGGYQVKTTLNIAMQRHAENAFTSHIAKYRERVPGIDGGLMTIDTQTAGIKAMVGGYDFSESQFNRATQAQRQMGSIFKPFVYTAAVDAGKRLSDTEVDEPFALGTTWAPRNVHRKHEGQMTYARGLIHSNNIVTSKLFLEIGANNVIACARRCHLPDPQHTYPSLALGCTECTVADAVAACNIFACHGVYTPPHILAWIKDARGQKVWHYHTQQESAISRTTAGQITHALRQTMAHMRTRMPHLWLDDEAIGKTGTTNNARTCWFVGSTPAYTTALYIGRDDNQDISGIITSVYQTLPIWLACHRAWCTPPRKQFHLDPRLYPRYIHAKTGYPVAPDHPYALLVYEPAQQTPHS